VVQVALLLRGGQHIELSGQLPFEHAGNIDRGKI